MDEDVPELMEAMAEKVPFYEICSELIYNAHCSVCHHRFLILKSFMLRTPITKNANQFNEYQI